MSLHRRRKPPPPILLDLFDSVPARPSWPTLPAEIRSDALTLLMEILRQRLTLAAADGPKEVADE
ncbi:MAG TPA: hypothetical protein VM597_17310 [Gemmataceae bacterium]|jgi:hypothetical protein|nr:hypothetical protein [Gemmataceae bacterium]